MLSDCTVTFRFVAMFSAVTAALGTAAPLASLTVPEMLPPACAVKESPAGHYVIEAHGAVDPLLLAAVTAWCAERGVLANSLRIESRTLEDVFLELTGRDLRT